MAEEASRDGLIPVRRDPNFARVTADTSIVVFLGRDLEMSLLAATNDAPTAYAGSKLSGSIELEGQAAYVETTKVRLAPPAALSIAFNLLFVLHEHKLIKSDKLIADLTSLLKGKVPEQKPSASKPRAKRSSERKRNA
jgi:hypothetical protein